MGWTYGPTPLVLVEGTYIPVVNRLLRALRPLKRYTICVQLLRRVEEFSRTISLWVFEKAVGALAASYATYNTSIRVFVVY